MEHAEATFCSFRQCPLVLSPRRTEVTTSWSSGFEHRIAKGVSTLRTRHRPRITISCRMPICEACHDIIIVATCEVTGKFELSQVFRIFQT
jgi:hypothetical protein